MGTQFGHALRTCCVSPPLQEPDRSQAANQVQEGAGEDQGEKCHGSPGSCLEQSLVLHTCYCLISNLQLCRG